MITFFRKRFFVSLQTTLRLELIRLLYITGIICTSLFLFSCGNSKEDYINDYSDFVEEVSEESISYSGDQWQNADSINDVYSSDYYEAYSHDMTDDEKARVSRLKGRYLGLRILDVGYDIKEGVKETVLPAIKDVFNQIEGAVEVIQEEIEKELEKDSLKIK